MIDTTNWVTDSTFWQQGTQAINSYVNNITNAYTMNETTNGSVSFANRVFTGGHRVVDHPNQTSGFGKSVRPPQRFSIALTGGGHAHIIPDLTQVIVYGNSVNEGGETSHVPTGVIGFGIETYRFAGTQQRDNTPTGNDAEMEIDVWIFDASNPTAYMKLENYPISTTGLGANYNPQYGTASVMWRGALGVSAWDRTYLTHNTQSNAWTYVGGWTLGHLFNETGRLVIAYRIHEVVAPYEITNNVVRQNSGTDVLSQQGIYAASTGMEHALEPRGSTIRLAGSPHLSFVDGSGTNHALVPHGSPIRLSEDNEPLFTTGTRHVVEPVGALGVGPSTSVQFSGTVQLSPVGAIGVGPGRGRLTVNETRVPIGGGESSGGGGFIPVVRLP